MHYLAYLIALAVFLVCTTAQAQFAFRVGNVGFDGARGVATNPQGDLFITGWFDESGDFDPGPGEEILTTDGSWDSFVASYDANGLYRWAFSIPNINSAAQGLGITAAPSGTSIGVGGWFSSSADFDPDTTSKAILNAPCNESAAFVAKYTTGGAYAWAFPLGGCLIDPFLPGVNLTVGVGSTPDDGVLATGVLRGEADLDPGPGEAPFLKAHGHAIFIASYDALGTYRWGFQIGDDSAADIGTGNAVVSDPLGGAIAVGVLHWPTDFDPEPGAEAILTPISGGGRSDAFVASYDEGGAYQWAFNIGSSGSDTVAWDVVIGDTGNAYVTGEFRGPTDFDPDPASSFVLNPANPPFASGFIASYSAGGGFRWAERLDGHGRALTMDALGNVVFAGTRPSFLGSYSPGGVQRWVMPLDTASSKGSATALGVATLPQSRLAVAGEFIGTVDFDPGPEQHLLTSDSSPPLGFTDIFVAAYADGGSFPVANEPESGLPTTFALEPAYPNPFNPRATIPFALPEAARVTLTVYDVLGRRIAILADGLYEAGRHNVVLDGSRLASGLYLVRALMEPEGGGNTRAFVQRLTLLK